MDDEVSVTELLEREGWQESPSAARGRLRVIAVMLAVVLGCGLAAILVRTGSESQQADNPSPAIFNLPHGPTGGLAGGGVPSSQDETEVTGTSTNITITNESAPGGSNGLPWATHRHKPSTVTLTQSASPPSESGGAAPGTPGTSSTSGTSGNKGGTGGSTPSVPENPAPSPSTPAPPCVLGLIWC